MGRQGARWRAVVYQTLDARRAGSACSIARASCSTATSSTSGSALRLALAKENAVPCLFTAASTTCLSSSKRPELFRDQHSFTHARLSEREQHADLQFYSSSSISERALPCLTRAIAQRADWWYSHRSSVLASTSKPWLTTSSARRRLSASSAMMARVNGP